MADFSNTSSKELLAQDDVSSEDIQLHYTKRNNTEYKSLKEKLLMLRKRENEITLLPVREIKVMRDRKDYRKTYVLERGNYDAPREEFQPGGIESVLKFNSGFPKNRLGLAQWLTDPHNPLTARVAVNRYWQMMFGKGLVYSSDDFGNQGHTPSHPELLD